MEKQTRSANNDSTLETGAASRAGRLGLSAGLLLSAALTPALLASENSPHAPFAQWANVPERGQFVVGLAYQESESYHAWAGSTYHNVTVRSGGEDYGIDINQGYLTLQYGITRKWAVDVAVGYTTVGWRYFSANQQAQSTSGLMDTAIGVRYQICDENETTCKYAPTLTFRAGAVLPGTFDQGFPFAPGNRSAAIEPELLLRKHFGWTGLGFFADGLFRWNRTTHNDQYLVSAGLFQQIKGWELDVAYRHLGTITGEDIILDSANPSAIYYPIELRENNDAIEAGFSYTTPKRKFQYGFYTRTVVDGSNSDAKFWIGGYVNFPFGGKHGAE